MGGIEKLGDGRYRVSVPVQDGTDRFIRDTLAEAQRDYRLNTAMARHGFGATEADADAVPLPEVVDRREWPVVLVRPDKTLGLARDRIADAIGIALKGAEPGRRHRLVVTLEPVAESPAYHGEGI